MVGECFEFIQDIEAGRTTQLQTFRKEDSRAVTESSKDKRMRVFKARGKIFEGY